MQLALQPKFQCAVPFTPVTGPRILIKDAAEKEMLLKAAAQTLMKLTGVGALVFMTCVAMISTRLLPVSIWQQLIYDQEPSQ